MNTLTLDMSRILQTAWTWIERNLLSLGGLLQFGYVVLALLAARVVWGLMRRRAQEWAERPSSPLVRGVVLSLCRIVWPALFCLILGVGVAAGKVLEQPQHILSAVASLATAWIIISLTSSLIGNPFWGRVVAFLVWSGAALSIMGLLKPTMHLLDSLALDFGEVRLSLLGLLRAVIVFIVAFEAAVVIGRFLEGRIRASAQLSPTVQILMLNGSRITLYAAAGLMALASMGISLTSLAVLGGALGVGIGFGLQKIFSNLISGVILLLDKSIKPGDIIEVGDVTGTIASINARYSLIETVDGKEVLIPNEELISGRVTNWTRSNMDVRLTVEVGVSYASDIRQAMRLMEQAAGEHPRVLQKPAPRCMVLRFGESSVDLMLGAWINDPDNGVMPAKSDLMLRIWDLFKAHGIEIPFPQRDVNIRSMPGAPGGE